MNKAEILKLKSQNRAIAEKLNLNLNSFSTEKKDATQQNTKSEFSHLDNVVKNPQKLSKGDQFHKAWKDLIHHGNTILFDRIVHPEYHSINHGVKIDKDQSRRVLLKRKGHVIVGPHSVIYENDDFLCIHRYTRVDKYNFFSMISGVSYKDGLVFTQQTAREMLEKDPSVEMDWNWSEYEN